MIIVLKIIVLGHSSILSSLGHHNSAFKPPRIKSKEILNSRGNAYFENDLIFNPSFNIC